ncbi:MAG: hypothetical protein M0019_05035 [Actinomycetota bacterium]|nr:hypothetical protein [Actinomycetota bacterium]
MKISKVRSIAPIGIAVIASACGSSAITSANSIVALNAVSAESQVTKAILAESGVHMDIRVTQNGVTTEQGLDATKTNSLRTITINGQTAKIIITPNAAFINAPAPILTANFGFTSQEASTFSSKWLSVAAGNSEYNALAAGSTIANIAQAVALSSPIKRSHAPINGVSVTELYGQSIGGKLALEVPNGSDLPLLGTIASSSIDVTLTFSNWGTSAKITPPTSAIPLTAPSSTSTTLAQPTSTTAAG